MLVRYLLVKTVGMYHGCAGPGAGYPKVWIAYREDRQ